MAKHYVFTETRRVVVSGKDIRHAEALFWREDIRKDGGYYDDIEIGWVCEETGEEGMLPK